MNRTPPTEVRRILRAEAGFGCPVAQGGQICGNPYLYYHHFDPPWAIKQHHDTEGMIALCGEHHAKADAGAFTHEQLRGFKQTGSCSALRGRFDWMREKLLAVVGGNYYYETPIPLRVRGMPVIAFERDEHSCFLLNVNMPSRASSPESRVRIERNDWIEAGSPVDLESPPTGGSCAFVITTATGLELSSRRSSPKRFFWIGMEIRHFLDTSPITPANSSIPCSR